MQWIRGFFLFTTFVCACLGMSSKLAAAPFQVGNWYVDLGETYTEAFSVNSSGSVFGVFCSSEKCAFYTDLKTGCDDGHEYQALSNSSTGAVAVTLRCVQIQRESGNPRHLLVLADFDQASKIVQGGGVLAIAIALRSGEFNVSRFDLSDATRAIQLAASAGTKANTKSRIGDQRL